MFKRVFFAAITVLLILAPTTANVTHADALITSNKFKTLLLHGKGGTYSNLGLPVSITRLDDRKLAVSSYVNIWIFDENTGETRELVKPEGVIAWYPTGLAYDKESQELFIANYLGKDILILKREKDGFTLKERIQDPVLLGAENISLSYDGKYFAVADFDSNGVLLFERGSNRKIWHRSLGRAHGVAFNLDGSRIVASGLAPPQIVSFDLKGQQISLRGSEGWKQDEYLWPTSISMDPISGNPWVSDAHLGKVRELGPDLREEKSFGMNGLGVGFLNMPYGILHEPDGRLWVTDTFKSRVLLFDKDHQILRAYISSPESSQVLISCASEKCITKESFFPIPGKEPIGPGYEKRINHRKKILHNFGPHGLKVWNPGYNYSAFNNPEAGQLALAGSNPLFSSTIYYWVQAQNQGANLIFGSPQTREWIMDFQGLACPIPLGLNHWLENEHLRSDQHPDYSLGEIISVCTSRMLQLSQSVAQGREPFSAYVQIILRKDPRIALSWLPSVFQSEKGRSYYQKLCAASDGSQRRKVSLDFIESVQMDRLIFLPELWVARIFSSFQESKEIQGTLGCVEGNN